jgi:hypothetical protein
MSNVDSLDPLAQRVRVALTAAYPEWSKYLGSCGYDDLEAAIPAPSGSNAGHLVIFTSKGKDLWVRFRPKSMCYCVRDETEMLDVIRKLLAETALFVVITDSDKWVETTLIRRGEPGDLAELEPNEVARVVSWSGKYDQTINGKKHA